MSQLSLLDENGEVIDAQDPIAQNPIVEEMFTPNGHRRCEHCRRRLHAFAGRLLCANPHCPGVPR